MIPLRQVHVPTPCPKTWDSMAGGPQTRFCDGCGKHVHNLSEMSRREGEALLARTGGHVCVYFYPDADGAPLPREAVPAHLPLATRPRPSVWRRAWAAALSGLLAVALSALGGAQAAVAKHRPAGKSAGRSAPKTPAKSPNSRPVRGQPFGGEITVTPRPLGGKPVAPPPLPAGSTPVVQPLGGVPVIPPVR